MISSKQKLGEVLNVQTASHHEDDMKEFIKNKVEDMGLTHVSDVYGNIYVQKGSANIFPCVVSHMDTVHDIHKEFRVFLIDDYYRAYNEKEEQVGVGGDDKVGVYITLAMLEHFDNIKVAFFSNEELGCLGSAQADDDFFKDVGYVFQCDRNSGKPRNPNRDFVDSIGGSKLFSKKFRKAISPIIKDFGYEFTSGGLTDVDQLGDNGIGVSVANMSCGYYRAHSDDEIVSYSEVMNTLKMVESLIEKLGEVKYKFTKPVGHIYKRSYASYNNFNSQYYSRYYNADYWNADTIDKKKDFDSEEVLELSKEDMELYGCCPKCADWLSCAEVIGDDDDDKDLWFCYSCETWFRVTDKKESIDPNQLNIDYGL
tara:strand:- start:1325 stop:2431 length:1107 start_codon:yes stop_codon:yes gene_type:complete